jgi:hypothetical protein
MGGWLDRMLERAAGSGITGVEYRPVFIQIARKAPRCRYSIFDSGVYRIYTVKWLFPQKKATFDALVMSISEAKML